MFNLENKLYIIEIVFILKLTKTVIYFQKKYLY